MRAPLICVIEDEEVIAGAVAARLKAEGFSVEIAGDGPQGVALCERMRPDLVVLDLMLPGLDGLEVCKRIQRDRPVPVLMLTARDDEADVLVGLGIGADDYMTKPFSPRELVARIKAVLRRVERRPEPPGEAVEIGPLRLDPAARTVSVDDARSTSRRPSSTSCTRSRRAPARCSRASSCSWRCGDGVTGRGSGPSTRTSAACGASWGPRSWSAPSMASATR